MKLEKWQIQALKKIKKESKKASKFLLDIKSQFLLDILDNSKFFKTKIKDIYNRVDLIEKKYQMTDDEKDDMNILTADLMTFCCEALSKDKNIFIVM